MTDYIKGIMLLRNPTAYKAIQNILKAAKSNKELSILDFELIGALKTNGQVKTEFIPIFDELGIDYEAFK